MNLTKIVTIALFAISLYLAYYLYSGVQNTIDERNSVAGKEALVIERLQLIREAEIVFQEVYGKYTANWDSLTDFILNGQVPIIERSEEIIPQAYGAEQVILHIDTLGFISAREKIFKKNVAVNSANHGTFMGFKVKVGDQVITNQKAYALKVGDKVDELGFLNDGVVLSLADVAVGVAVSKGKNLINLWYYQFNPNVPIKDLAFKPNDNVKFEIYVGMVDKAGVKVQVLEVKDPSPDNPLRQESNEAKNRKPLRFGSRTDVSTSGNWE